jgi:hypothetical protein
LAAGTVAISFSAHCAGSRPGWRLGRAHGGAAAPAGDEADLADDRALLDRHGEVRIGLADLDLQRASAIANSDEPGSLR